MTALFDACQTSTGTTVFLERSVVVNPGILAATLLLMPLSAAQASTWHLVRVAPAQLVFVGDLPVGTPSAPMIVRVLKSYETPISLGGWYAHRSATLDYEIDCRSGRYALARWQFHRGSLGQGDVVWADDMDAPVFDSPARGSAEQQILEAACAP
jgi:hypothetical protein